MKKNNLWRIIWVVGIYGILILVLYLVIDYKVKWEGLDLHSYLYFYNCSNDVCTSITPQDNYYGKLLCEDDVCPFIKEKKDNILIMSKDDIQFLYDYEIDNIINNIYVNYRFTNGENYIVSREDEKQGVINALGDILVDFDYLYIKEYMDGYYSVKENGKYSIFNKDKNIDTGYKYDDVILINERIYAFSIDNGNSYQIAEYSTGNLVNNNKYSYIYVFNKMIFTVNNKIINIYNENLKSNLLMPIHTYYTYQEEKERSSLNLSIKNNILTFIVFNNNDSYTLYRYDIKNNKLL